MAQRKKKEDFEAKYKDLEEQVTEFVVEYTVADHEEGNRMASAFAEKMKKDLAIVIPDSEGDEPDDDEDLDEEDEDEEE